METRTLTNDWLEATTANVVGNPNAAGTTSNYTLGNCSLGQYHSPTWTYSYSYPQRIKLTLSEIEKLRKAAKADKAVKDILAKFTSLIEIAVDFN